MANEATAEELAQQIEQLTAERDSALEMVTELSEQIAAQSKVTDGSKIVVTIKKKKFYLVGQNFNVPGKGMMTALEVSKDAETLASFLEKESEVLQEVTE